MAFQLRPYQHRLKADIHDAWNTGADNVLAVLPTGGGKTVILANIVHEHNGACCVIAHRQELVGQISLALAREGVRHRVIGPRDVIKACVNNHLVEVGQSYYDPTAICAVAGVDTLVRRADSLKNWLPTVTLWIQDEAHHITADNKWGKAAELFPAAKGLGVTATPYRADGKGLGRHADGIIDVMVQGPTMRQLIRMGNLTDYRIFSPSSNLDVSSIPISKTTGDYSPTKTAEAVKKSSLVAGGGKSQIVGDVVAEYLRIAPGLLGVTFVPDVETAHNVSKQFNSQGVPAAVLSAKTPDAERSDLLRKFRRREIMQLVNVDILGEGFDCPGIEVVSMARPTKSLPVFMQQFGRGLRPAPGKTYAIIIDHVGNIFDPVTGYINHGLPDQHREWTLNGSRRGGASESSDDAIPLRVCHECEGAYERFLAVCPYCYAPPPPPSMRSSAKFVDGDLHELDPETLAAMRGEVAGVDQSLEDAVAEYRLELQNKHCPKVGEMSNVKRFAAKYAERQETLPALREAMAWFGGYMRHEGHSDSEIFKAFYLRFGLDWLSAQTISAPEMIALTQRVQKVNERLGL